MKRRFRITIAPNGNLEGLKVWVGNFWGISFDDPKVLFTGFMQRSYCAAIEVFDKTAKPYESI